MLRFLNEAFHNEVRVLCSDVFDEIHWESLFLYQDNKWNFLFEHNVYILIDTYSKIKAQEVHFFIEMVVAQIMFDLSKVTADKLLISIPVAPFTNMV